MVSAGGAHPGADPLGELEYVVVDVETTGGSVRRGHGVTEIAAVSVDGGGRVLDEYATLVDPGRPISPWVVRLTGITDEMVRGAPPFADIAARVRSLLTGRVFVAHNASFDWRFVSHEFARGTGLEPPPVRRLCTVRLARRLLPQLPSRSLDALMRHFRIPNDARHRALGDARATAVLLRRLLERLEARQVVSWTDLEALLSRRRRAPAGDETRGGG